MAASRCASGRIDFAERARPARPLVRAGQGGYPIRGLLLAHIAEAVVGARVPLKLGRQAAVRRAATATLTMEEARQRFALSNRVLRRLAPDGLCLISGRLGRGGAVRFYAEALTASAQALRRSACASSVSVTLGVLAYCLPAFVTARLLARITDADAIRMADEQPLYDRASVDRLVARLSTRRCEAPESDMALSVVTAGLFAPGHLARAFKACLDGRIEVYGTVEGTCALSSRLRVDRCDADRFLQAERALLRPSGDVELSPRQVGLLLAVSDVAVGELIQADLLPALQAGRRWRIRLGAVTDFNDRYYLASEILGFPPPGVRGLSSMSLRAAFSTRHLRIWERP